MVTVAAGRFAVVAGLLSKPTGALWDGLPEEVWAIVPTVPTPRRKAVPAVATAMIVRIYALQLLEYRRNAARRLEFQPSAPLLRKNNGI